MMEMLRRLEIKGRAPDRRDDQKMLPLDEDAEGDVLRRLLPRHSRRDRRNPYNGRRQVREEDGEGGGGCGVEGPDVSAFRQAPLLSSMLSGFGQLFDGKSFYSRKIPEIERDNRKTEGYGSGCDYKVVRPHHLTFAREVCPDPRINPSCCQIEGEAGKSSIILST